MYIEGITHSYMRWKLINGLVVVSKLRYKLEFTTGHYCNRIMTPLHCYAYCYFCIATIQIKQNLQVRIFEY
jgi:hypothetical protein